MPGIGHHTLLRELTAEAVDTLVAIAGHDSGSPLLAVELRQVVPSQRGRVDENELPVGTDVATTREMAGDAFTSQRSPSASA